MRLLLGQFLVGQLLLLPGLLIGAGFGFWFLLRKGATRWLRNDIVGEWHTADAGIVFRSDHTFELFEGNTSHGKWRINGFDLRLAFQGADGAMLTGEDLRVVTKMHAARQFRSRCDPDPDVRASLQVAERL